MTILKKLYYRFTTTLSTCINKFSIKLSCNKDNKMTNLLYAKECKYARRDIRDAFDKSLNADKKNRYKALSKRGKRYYINKKQEKLYTSLS